MVDKKIQMKHKNGAEWDTLFPVSKAEYVLRTNGKTVEDEFNTLNATVSNKVDKVSGKQLSTNDYTTTEKTKLAGLKDHSSEISTINTELGKKAVATTVYNKTEIDSKLTVIKLTPIPVQKTAPTDSNLWFEELV